MAHEYFSDLRASAAGLDLNELATEDEEEAIAMFLDEPDVRGGSAGVEAAARAAEVRFGVCVEGEGVGVRAGVWLGCWCG